MRARRRDLHSRERPCPSALLHAFCLEPTRLRCTVPHPPPRTGQTIPPVTTSGTCTALAAADNSVSERASTMKMMGRWHGYARWYACGGLQLRSAAEISRLDIHCRAALLSFSGRVGGPQHSPTLSVEAKQIAICSTKWCTRHTDIVLKTRRSSAVHPAAPVFAIHYSTLTLTLRARGSTHCVIPEKPQTTCAVRPCRATCATPGSDRPDRPPPRVDRQRHCRASPRIGTVARCRSTAQAPQATCGVCPP